MPTPTERRRAIEEILTSSEVQSQAELLELLAERGLITTQPALSRDLRSLGAAKRAGAYTLLESDRVTPLATLKSLLRGARPAGDHMLVVRCEPGAASAVARALESEPLDGLVGTVAGDDTVFCAVESPAVGDAITELIQEVLA